MLKNKIYQVTSDDGFNIEGTFLEITEAGKLKLMLDQCPDEHIYPIEIREVPFTDISELQVRSFILGTINLATGQIGQLLESKRVTKFKGEYQVHLATQVDYLEIHYYGSNVACVECLKRLREEHNRVHQV